MAGAATRGELRNGWARHGRRDEVRHGEGRNGLEWHGRHDKEGQD